MAKTTQHHTPSSLIRIQYLSHVCVDMRQARLMVTIILILVLDTSQFFGNCTPTVASDFVTQFGLPKTMVAPHNSILGAIYHVSELYKTEKVHLHFYCFSIKYETYTHSKASCQCDQESECNQCHERREPHHHACRCLQHCKEGVYSY